jgi:hypothetical protein
MFTTVWTATHGNGVILDSSKPVQITYASTESTVRPQTTSTTDGVVHFCLTTAPNESISITGLNVDIQANGVDVTQIEIYYGDSRMCLETGTKYNATIDQTISASQGSVSNVTHIGYGFGITFTISFDPNQSDQSVSFRSVGVCFMT